MLTVDRVAGSTLVAFGLLVLWESRALPLGSLRNPGPAYMPVVLAAILVAFGALTALAGRQSPPIAAIAWPEWRHGVAILGLCAFAALALERVGYRVTVAVVAALLLGVVERRGGLATAALALGLSLGSFFLFATLLRVPLPRGPFGL
jgi:hypothetical protein